MTAFDDTIRLDPRPAGSPGTFIWEVPDGWQQGRGAYGGLPIGAMTRAVERAQGDAGRPVRSVSAQLSAPAVVGQHQVTAAPLRIGKGMSTWTAQVDSEGGERVGTASVITGLPRRQVPGVDEAERGTITAPSAPPAAQVPAVPTPPPFPTFTQNFEYRVVSGIPLSGVATDTVGWIGFREPVPWSAPTLLGLSDAWYTATLVALTELIPIATVNFAATILVDPDSLIPGEPLLHHGFVSASRDGFASEQRRLWSADGRLVVDSLQTMAVG